MENRDIARLLAETADLMEIAAEFPPSIRAYKAGAEAIAELAPRDRVRFVPTDVADEPAVARVTAAVIESRLPCSSISRLAESTCSRLTV